MRERDIDRDLLAAWLATMALSKVANFLFEGTRSMFYLRGPRELALGPDDAAPTFATNHGL